ncbi:hypothetical protein F3Y22_tig00110174pilonHSYRG00259 [Hibiscus syriacus]|uniref:Uncharacterized protein n=1 Tax=Hibiscus syriacus TaxID=106335 RepID=A0A6A3BFK7_HIBSY|nr:hypothetical protein F3Y22_tig00110174pilonHSYRG00259 [Hibiscus syriacus]
MAVKRTIALRTFLVGGITVFAKVAGAMKAAGGAKLGAAATAMTLVDVCILGSILGCSQGSLSRADGYAWRSVFAQTHIPSGKVAGAMKAAGGAKLGAAATAMTVAASAAMTGSKQDPRDGSKRPPK